MKTAIIIGASGLVGSTLTDLLIHDYRFTKVIVLARRSMGIKHPKLEEHIIDFRKPETWKPLIKGDVLFSALGTTLKSAGSKEAQYEVDFTFQFIIAEAASQNHVPVYVLISSIGANANSSNFYLRMKGQLEDAVKLLPFQSINILRPASLDGERKEYRIAERISLPILKAVNSFGLLKKYRPIHRNIVAEKMVLVSLEQSKGLRILENEEIFKI